MRLGEEGTRDAILETLGHGARRGAVLWCFFRCIWCPVCCLYGFSIRLGLVGHALVGWFPSPSFPLIGAVLHSRSTAEGAASFPSGGWFVFRGGSTLRIPCVVSLPPNTAQGGGLAPPHHTRCPYLIQRGRRRATMGRFFSVHAQRNRQYLGSCGGFRRADQI